MEGNYVKNFETHLTESDVSQFSIYFKKNFRVLYQQGNIATTLDCCNEDQNMN